MRLPVLLRSDKKQKRLCVFCKRFSLPKSMWRFSCRSSTHEALPTLELRPPDTPTPPSRFGRSAYVCTNASCVHKLYGLQIKPLNHALRASWPTTTYQQLLKAYRLEETE
ncbi:MAG: DUF448 domain-containing protein [Vampirovibrionales bacterium]